MSGISWAGTGVSGSWSNGALWNGGIAPGAADQVTIAAGGQYAVTISGVAQVAALTLNAAGGELYDSGSLTVSSVFALDAGTLALAGGGLSGGTLALAGGVLQADGGSLANIAVDGTLNLSAQYADLFLRQGVSFAGANGSGAGSILLTGGYAQLDAVGSQSIADTVISFGTVNGGGASGGESALGVSDPGGAITPSTLTLTSTSWIRQTAGRGLIYAGAMNGLPGSSLPDEILNQGTIALSGGTISVQGNGVFANAGMIAISNGADFSVNSGGFSNSGSITVSGATLSFGGDFAASRLSALGNVTFSSGTLSITGTANNAGGTLSLGSGGNVVGPVMLSGTIAGGTVIDAGGGLLLSSGAGVLDDVIYRGTLVLAAGNTVTLRDSSAFENLAGSGNGSIAVTGIGSDLSLQGTTTLNNATISLGASGGEAVIGTLDGFLASSGTTATLGAGLVINQTGQDAQIMANGSTALVGVGFADSLINQGTINAGLVGGNMILGGVGYFGNSGTIAVTGGDILAVSVASFANSGLLAVGNGGVVELGKGGGFFSAGDVFTNTGTIALNAGTLVLAGVASTAALGRITASNGGTVIVSGNLENAGSTLSLGAGGVLPNLSLAGTISGGVISDPSHLLSIGFLGAADLNGVTYNGTLALAAGNFLRVQNGITVGAVTVASAGAVLDFQGTQDFNNAVVTLGNSASAAAIDFSHANSSGQATTLTLGNLLDITQSGAMAVVGGGDTVAGDMLINTGTITGAVAGGTLSLGGPDFDNQGFITVSNGDTLAITTGARRHVEFGEFEQYQFQFFHHRGEWRIELQRRHVGDRQWVGLRAGGIDRHAAGRGDRR